MDILFLYREADACPAHQDVHRFVERARAVDRQVGAVVGSYVRAVQNRACRHQGSHRGHHLEIVDRVSNLGHIVDADSGRVVVDQTINCFIPALSPIVSLAPTRVATFGDELLIVVVKWRYRQSPASCVFFYGCQKFGVFSLSESGTTDSGE